MYRLIVTFINGDGVVLTTNRVRIRNGKLITRLEKGLVAWPLTSIEVLDCQPIR